MVRILVKECLEDRSCLTAVAGKDITLLHVLGPFAARQGWLIESHIADEVEGVEVSSGVVSKRL